GDQHEFGRDNETSFVVQECVESVHLGVSYFSVVGLFDAGDIKHPQCQRSLMRQENLALVPASISQLSFTTRVTNPVGKSRFCSTGLQAVEAA
ncbi:MAG: hypothetical protein KDA90_14680, partial [Planctomycetaceae bacterium]|nr:hypothetical protein [Planctomycetaceae bacterium]